LLKSLFTFLGASGVFCWFSSSIAMLLYQFSVRLYTLLI
jgi:hypothetical protein